MKLVVVRAPSGILLLRDSNGLRLPLVDDGAGESDLDKVKTILAYHGLVLVVERLDTMSAPRGDLEVLFAEAKPSNDAPGENNAWLMTDGDLSAALHTFGKCCAQKGALIYGEAAELLRNLRGLQTA